MNNELAELTKQEPSVDFLKDAVSKAEELQKELVIWIIVNEQGELSSKVKSGNVDHIPAILTLYRPPGNIVLTSHTHYPPNIYSDYDTRNGILYSLSDINGLLDGGRDDLHIGSFFIPNPFGITFFAGIERDLSIEFSSPPSWNVLNPYTGEEDSIVSTLDANRFDMTKVATEQAHAFEHIMPFEKCRVKLVFFPYSTMAESNISLAELLIGNGLSKLIQGTIFEADFRENQVGSVLDVVKRTKRFAQVLWGKE